MDKGISIILCTYNGKSRLEPTLRHLALQRHNIPCELIVVDNASVDGTKEFADTWWHKNGTKNILYRSVRQPDNLGSQQYASRRIPSQQWRQSFDSNQSAC